MLHLAVAAHQAGAIKITDKIRCLAKMNRDIGLNTDTHRIIALKHMELKPQLTLLMFSSLPSRCTHLFLDVGLCGAVIKVKTLAWQCYLGTCFVQSTHMRCSSTLAVSHLNSTGARRPDTLVNCDVSLSQQHPWGQAAGGRPHSRWITAWC